MATTATIPNRSIPIATFTIGAQRVEVPLNEEWARFFRDLQVRSGGVSGVVQPSGGGTGFSSYSVGDMLYADTATSFARLNAVAAGNALISNGVGAPPSWGKVSLTTTVNGVLPEANGGTGFAAFGAGVSAWLQDPTSAKLLAAVPDATGAGGGLVFADAPALITPDLDTPTAGDLTNCIGYTAANIVGTIAITQGGTGQTTANAALNALLPSQATHAGKALVTDGTNTAWSAGAVGTVTSVGVSGANGIGVAGSPITTSGVIALSLGAITPASVASAGAVTGSNLSGTNTGDQTVTLTGDVTGSGTGSFATTLATVNANVGAFGSSTSIPTFTVNGKGLITAASGNAVIAPAGTLTGATLAAGVTASSLTSVGTLTGLSISASGSQVVDLNSTAAGGGFARFATSGTVYGFIGNASDVTGGTLGTFAVRAQGAFVVSTNGATERFTIDTSGNLIAMTVGAGLRIAEGSNAKMGTATLVAGTVVVNTTAVTANSRIFLTAQSLGTVTVGQGLAVSARTAGTSFTITSGNAVDTSVVGWIIFEPS